MPQIDFVLNSCPPLSDGLWLASSVMIDVSVVRCGKLLAAFLVFKMLYDWYEGRDEGRASMHLRTLLTALTMVVFFKYYKQLLMTFDDFVSMISVYDEVRVAVERAAKDTGVSAPTGFFTSIVKWINQTILNTLSLLTIGTAFQVMHYIRAIGLLLLAQVGPIAALLSWLPGPFKKSWQQWFKSYISISCWAITLEVFWCLNEGMLAVVDIPLANIVQGIVMFLAVLTTPMWTAKFIGSDSMGGLTSGVSNMASAAASAVTKMPIKL